MYFGLQTELSIVTVFWHCPTPFEVLQIYIVYFITTQFVMGLLIGLYNITCPNLIHEPFQYLTVAKLNDITLCINKLRYSYNMSEKDYNVRRVYCSHIMANCLNVPGLLFECPRLIVWMSPANCLNVPC